jgi:hypothetical protein
LRYLIDPRVTGTAVSSTFEFSTLTFEAKFRGWKTCRYSPSAAIKRPNVTRESTFV